MRTVRLLPNDFEAILGPLSPYVRAKIEGYKFVHTVLDDQSLEVAIIDLIEELRDQDLPKSGPARHHIWESGWGQNLADFDPKKAGPELAKPRYFDKSPIVRWNGSLCIAESPDYEYGMLCVLQHWLFERYLSNRRTVYEFGCGTGHNLFRVREANPKAKLVGLDWAESAVTFVNLQGQANATHNLTANKFDFFNPDPRCKLDPGCGVFTVAALEQVGDEFGPWLDFIRSQKPAVVVNIEPLNELLSPSKLLDYLCIAYCEKRNYLSGYLTKLRELETQGAITLHNEVRTTIGSKFIEGYNVVVWTPEL